MSTQSGLRFFSAHDDQVAVLEFLLGLGCRVLEAYSEFDADLREFKEPSDADDALKLGVDKYGNGHTHLLWVHAPEHCGKLRIKRRRLSDCNGATFRYEAFSNGGITLQLGGVHKEFLTTSWIARSSERRSVAWGIADGVKWSEADQMWGRIFYHLASRVAVARLPGVPIHQHAWTLARNGAVLTEAVGSTLKYSIKDAKLIG